MQQHTFGVGQGSARPQQHTACVLLCVAVRRPTQAFEVIGAMGGGGGRPLRGGGACPAGLSRWDGQARHVSTSPFSCPQKVPARK